MFFKAKPKNKKEYGLELKTEKTILTKDEKKKLKLEKKKIEKSKRNERIAKTKFYDQWVELMAHMGIYNKLNQTLTPRNIEVKPYGFKCEIHYVKAVSLSKIETEQAIKTIEEDFQCLFISHRIPKSNKMEAVFIQKQLCPPNYEPIKLKPYQVYMSLGIEFQTLIADMRKYPHIFITGASNMGKTKFIDGIMLNLIKNCSPEELELYIFQCDKHDQRPYIRAPHTKCYANTIEEMCIEICYIKDKMQELNDFLMPYVEKMECTNIFEFNELIDKGVIKNKRKFPCRYMVIDEYASLMPEGETNKHLKECKEIIQTKMEEIIRLGRSVGFYVIIATQRGTIDMIPSFVKAMCATNITFKVNNKKSEELTGFDGAASLEPREFIAVATEIETGVTSTHFGTTPNLTPSIIKSHLLEYINRYPCSFPFERYDNYLPTSKKKGKEKESILENINNIPTAVIEEAKKEAKKKEIEEKKVIALQDIKPSEEEVKQLKKPNKKSQYYDPNWKDPSTDPNVKVIDETPISRKKANNKI